MQKIKLYLITPELACSSGFVSLRILLGLSLIFLFYAFHLSVFVLPFTFKMNDICFDIVFNATKCVHSQNKYLDTLAIL